VNAVVGGLVTFLVMTTLRTYTSAKVYEVAAIGITAGVTVGFLLWAVGVR